MQLTDATVIEVEAGLVETGRWWSLRCFHLVCQWQQGSARGDAHPLHPGGWPSEHRSERHIPGSQNAWGPCSLQHTAHDSSRWAAGPCIGHSHWCRWYRSLLVKGQGEGWVGAWAPDPWQHCLLGDISQVSHRTTPSCPPAPIPPPGTRAP